MQKGDLKVFTLKLPRKQSTETTKSYVDISLDSAPWRQSIERKLVIIIENIIIFRGYIMKQIK